MAIEVVGISYTRLFEVRLLHHYWLDDFVTTFDAIDRPAVKTRRLLEYDVRRFLSVGPNASTSATIAGLQGVFRMTGLGFLVAVPDAAVVPLDTTWEFFVTATASEYANYTALSLRRQPIADVVDPTDPHSIRRYKANVPVLSNLTGASQGRGDGQRLFLSRPFIDGADAGDGVEALVTAGDELRQLTGDPPGAQFHVLGPKDKLPVYVHQGDVPPIVPPPGSTGAPARGIEMAADTPPTVAAVVRLFPRRLDDEAFSFVGTDGAPKTPPRVFEVHLRNRWTSWRYRDRTTGAVTTESAGPLPLTYFGAAQDKRKPSTAAVGADLDLTDPLKITRLVSDIYV
jgi:hypothetical protein